MSQLVVLPLIVPFIVALLSIALRKTNYSDLVAVSGSLAYLGAVIMLSRRVLVEGPVTLQAGGWPAPFGITLIADSLSVLMLLLTSAVFVAVNIYSSGFIGQKGKRNGYYTFLHFMAAGMSGAFVTGDLFNLFVMFEIVLISSYALIAYTSDKDSLLVSMRYVVLNLIGSSLMLISIGGLYAVTGTLNIADMASVLSQGSVNMAPVLAFSLLLFCVFGIKSGLVPFHFWAPPVYSTSPPPVAAFMAGISKKVGIYAVIRIYFTVFSAASIPENALLFAGEPVNTAVAYLAGAMAVATLLLGGFSALHRQSIDRLLSYSSVGQIGFIFIPLSIAMLEGSNVAMTAALVYLVSHGLAKPALFMISGLIERMTGTSKLEDLGGLSESSIVFSASFFVSAFSLVGIPPLLGFFGKMLVFKSAIVSGNLLLLTALLAGAVITLIYFSRTWLEVFFGEPVDYARSEVSKKEVFAVAVLTVLIVVLGVGFEPLYQLVEKASEAALNTEVYVETVMEES